jgi:hypothetical protein
MANEAVNPVLRIWCPPHRINLVLKAAAEAVADGTGSKLSTRIRSSCASSKIKSLR